MALSEAAHSASKPATKGIGASARGSSPGFWADNQLASEDAAKKVINIRQMRASIGRLDELVAAEGELVISRRGRPIARVLPSVAASPISRSC